MIKIKNFFNAPFFNSFWFYVLLFLVVVGLTNARQKKITNFNCEICGDKLGYYMFLPATFQLGFTTEKYPKNLAIEHGYGFTIDTIQNKIITKFTIGVALMLSPFYAIGTIINNTFSLHEFPYSNYFLFFINIGAGFYLVLGFFF